MLTQILNFVQLHVLSNRYIVEKLDEVPTLEVNNSKVNEIFLSLIYEVMIYRFNGLWPQWVDLHQWVYSNWSKNYKIILFSKGFFVVHFYS